MGGRREQAVLRCVMSQDRDGGVGGLKGCVVKRIAVRLVVHSCMIWLRSFGTKRVLVVVRNYEGVLLQDEGNKGVAQNATTRNSLPSQKFSMVACR